MSAKKTRLILISGAFVLLVLLFISPRQKINSPSEIEVGFVPEKSLALVKKETLDYYLALALKNLNSALRKNHDSLQSKRELAGLVVFWDKQKRPDLAAYFTEASAENSDSALVWYKAGNRYYYAIPFNKDVGEVPLLYQRAAFCFDKCLQKDSSFVDAKIMLAACMVEGSKDPMQGITLLRTIEKTDSNNVKLQMTFALFSVKSGQLEKAISRFNKVLKIDSTAIEVYLHLADAFEKLNQPNQSLMMLEKYQAKTNDPIVKMEIGKYIDQLRKSN